MRFFNIVAAVLGGASLASSMGFDSQNSFEKRVVAPTSEYSVTSDVATTAEALDSSSNQPEKRATAATAASTALPDTTSKKCIGSRIAQGVKGCLSTAREALPTVLKEGEIKSKGAHGDLSMTCKSCTAVFFFGHRGITAAHLPFSMGGSKEMAVLNQAIEVAKAAGNNWEVEIASPMRNDYKDEQLLTEAITKKFGEIPVKFMSYKTEGRGGSYEKPRKFVRKAKYVQKESSW